MKLSGQNMIEVSADDDAIVVNDIFELANDLPDGSQEKMRMIRYIINNVKEGKGITSFTSQEIIDGFSNRLSGEKQEEFNELKSKSFRFSSKGEAFDISRQLPNITISGQ